MYLNEYSKNNDEITEDLILKVHNLVCGKSITYKNKFRDGQNVVKNSETGSIVYLPPEAKDVKDLIGQMIDDFNNDCDIPIPIKAKQSAIIRKLAAISSPLKNPSSPQKPNAKRTAIAAVIIMRKRIPCLITRFLVQKFRISCPTKQVEKIKRIIAIIEDVPASSIIISVAIENHRLFRSSQPSRTVFCR